MEVWTSSSSASSMARGYWGEKQPGYFGWLKVYITESNDGSYTSTSYVSSMNNWYSNSTNDVKPTSEVTELKNLNITFKGYICNKTLKYLIFSLVANALLIYL